MLGAGFVLLSTVAWSQTEFCNDFKEGVFYIPPTEQLPISYRVVRTATTQIETVMGAPKGVLSEQDEAPKHVIIRWIDNCSYRIWFDESKGELTEAQEIINRNNGALIEFLSVEDNCVRFRSTLAKEDQIISFLGQQCKD